MTAQRVLSPIARCHLKDTVLNGFPMRKNLYDFHPEAVVSEGSGGRLTLVTGEHFHQQAVGITRWSFAHGRNHSPLVPTCQRRYVL